MSDSDDDSIITPRESQERTKQWLEDVLGNYYAKMASSSEEQVSKDRVNKKSVVKATILEFDIGSLTGGDRMSSTLSDLLSLRVTYRLSSSKEGAETTEHLLVKIPPNDPADREMAQAAQVDRREIHFYTQTLPQIEAWAKGRSVPTKLAVPRCYFAKYTKDSFLRRQKDKQDLAVITDAASVLVLEDMRPAGYSTRDFKTGLSLGEAQAALGEIAKIHALSWAMQEATGVPLDQVWEHTYRPHKAASAYKMMIEHGFPTLSDFLSTRTPDGKELLGKLQALHPKAIELLYELLKPPPPPSPSCLTHMDFWCSNLLFRTNKDAGVDCLILDWQMMAVSRPTHDVALLLFTSLPSEVREGHSEDLLKHYWTAFQATASSVGVEVPFDFGTIQAEFKKSQLLALLLVIGSIDLALDSTVTEDRLLAALRDMARGDLI